MKELREEYKQETGREPLGNDYRDWLESKNIALQERVEGVQDTFQRVIKDYENVAEELIQEYNNEEEADKCFAKIEALEHIQLLLNKKQ